MESAVDRLGEVRRRIASAAKEAGREPGAVTLPFGPVAGPKGRYWHYAVVGRGDAETLGGRICAVRLLCMYAALKTIWRASVPPAFSMPMVCESGSLASSIIVR